MSDKPVLKSIVVKFETYYEETSDSNDSFTFTYEPVNIDSLICSYVKESELPNGTKKQDDTSGATTGGSYPQVTKEEYKLL